jgi:hypothetical protein
MQEWSPMALDPSSVPAVLEAAAGKLVVIPALESGNDPNNPTRPHYEFGSDFPYANGGNELAPGLLSRLHDLIALFRNNMQTWAQIYDRQGQPRYAVQIIHAYAQVPPADVDDAIGLAFVQVAAEISASEGIDFGFTLDVSSGGAGSYTFAPARSGQHSNAAHRYWRSRASSPRSTAARSVRTRRASRPSTTTRTTSEAS